MSDRIKYVLDESRMPKVWYNLRVSYDQKPYRRAFMETFGARCVASPSNETNGGRQVLATTPDSNGSLGIAISEAVEVAATRRASFQRRRRITPSAAPLTRRSAVARRASRARSCSTCAGMAISTCRPTRITSPGSSWITRTTRASLRWSCPASRFPPTSTDSRPMLRRSRTIRCLSALDSRLARVRPHFVQRSRRASRSNRNPRK